MKVVEAKIRDEGIEVFIPAKYLTNAFEMGVTTNVTGKVTNQMDMLQHFAIEIESGDNDSHFGRFVDGVCESAIGDGLLFVDFDEEE